MPDDWISFRIKEDSTYQQRYDDLHEAINDHASGIWDPDTSFVGIRSDHGIDTIGQALKPTLNSTTDHLVIRQIDFINMRYINDPGDGFLALFPKAKKL